MTRKYLVAITGPTASGKTQLSIHLAQYFKTEIISCDSRQVFKELNIGVARPSEEELKTIKHHFIASKSILDDYSAGQFENEATHKIKSIHNSHNVCIMVGGSGLYEKAVIEGLDSFPKIDQPVKDQIAHLYNSQGNYGLKKKLKELDPVYYNQVDLNNTRRLIRALEVSISNPIVL